MNSKENSVSVWFHAVAVLVTVLIISMPAAPASGQNHTLTATTISVNATGLSSVEREVVEHIKEHGIAVSDFNDLDPLIQRASDHKLVLLGEASHGTSEYYTWRSEISKRLIEEHGFDFVIVEADWPLAYPVNLHVKHLDDTPVDSRQALASFHRWPQWMWGNEEVLELITWMHSHNSELPASQRAGFYGLDIYAHNRGMEDVITFLEETDSESAQAARRHYSCFDRHPDMQSYLQMVHHSREHCGEDLESVYELMAENRNTYEIADSVGFAGAYQSARMVVYAERHLRGNLQQGPQSWNHRVEHFYDATSQLLERYGDNARGIVWAHNTHIGDARATDMRNAGMKNIGQIAREELGEDNVYAIGFGTGRGEVLAGRQWEGEMEKMTVPQAAPGSYENLMLQSEISPLLLLFDNPDEHTPLMEPRGNRAIGVVYHPEQDATRNYVETIMPLRYNAFIFFEETKALTPLE